MTSRPDGPAERLPRTHAVFKHKEVVAFDALWSSTRATTNTSSYAVTEAYGTLRSTYKDYRVDPDEPFEHFAWRAFKLHHAQAAKLGRQVDLVNRLAARIQWPVVLKVKGKRCSLTPAEVWETIGHKGVAKLLRVRADDKVKTLVNRCYRAYVELGDGPLTNPFMRDILERHDEPAAANFGEQDRSKVSNATILRIFVNECLDGEHEIPKGFKAWLKANLLGKQADPRLRAALGR